MVGRSGRGAWEALMIPLVAVIVVALVLVPVVRHANRAVQDRARSQCLNNLKSLGTAIKMYSGDHNGLLPSSFLCSHSEKWKDDDFCRFAGGEFGTIPPKPGTATYPALLHSYYAGDIENVCCCPCYRSPPHNTDATDQDDTLVSYFWKAAVDRAWYAGAKRTDDYPFPGQQIVLYERRSWHGGDMFKGLNDGNKINCLYIDGHTATAVIRSSGYHDEECSTPVTIGEPAWFNYSVRTPHPQFNTGTNWDPEHWRDNLE